MVRESTFEETRKAIRLGKFALIRPVMTFTEGRCVARIRWIPMARAFWASWASGRSIVVRWVDSEALSEESYRERLRGAAGVLVPGGFGHRALRHYLIPANAITGM
jgi:hypothetical protein